MSLARILAAPARVDRVRQALQGEMRNMTGPAREGRARKPAHLAHAAHRRGNRTGKGKVIDAYPAPITPVLYVACGDTEQNLFCTRKGLNTAKLKGWSCKRSATTKRGRVISASKLIAISYSFSQSQQVWPAVQGML